MRRKRSPFGNGFAAGLHLKRLASSKSLIGFDESQVSPAKRDSSDDDEEEETLGERMRKRAKLLEEEAEQLEAKAKQLENKAMDTTEASVDDTPCK